MDDKGKPRKKRAKLNDDGTQKQTRKRRKGNDDAEQTALLWSHFLNAHSSRSPCRRRKGWSLLRWLLLRVNACAAHKSKGPQTAPTVFLFFGDTPTEGESLSTYRLRANPTHTCRRVFYKRNCATSLQFEWINRPFVTWWTVRRISRCPKSFTACASRYRAFEKYI